jgi:REP element-mobilizing transposase RayT
LSRREVVFLPGQYYHIYNRGANREAIFRSAENYRFLLRRVKEQASLRKITIIAYCLMPNHYHFLLRQETEEPVSSFVQAVFNSYTKAYNQRYGRTGTLFEERFKAIAVEKSEYLILLCRYIHYNPVGAGLAKHPAEWQFSNYLEWVGQREGSLVDLEFVKENFPQHDEYEQFVLNYAQPEKLSTGLQEIPFG